MIENMIINWDIVVKGFLLGWFVANFSPFQKFYTKYIYKRIKVSYIRDMFVCHKCLSFHSTWIIGLILTFWAGSIEFLFFESIIAALLAYSFEKVMASFKTYL